MENEKKDAQLPEKCPLQLIQHNDVTFMGCDSSNRDVEKCRSCLTSFCRRPFKIYHNSRNYLACEVQRSQSTNSTRSLPNTEKDNESYGKRCLQCAAPKCKTSFKKPKKDRNSICKKLKEYEMPEIQSGPIKQSVLRETNKYRRLHNANHLKMDEKLSSYAQQWADQLADHNKLETRPAPLYGENIMCVRRSKFSVEQILKLWYQEKYSYDYLKPGFNLYTGHFTQLVWRQTKFLGVGVACDVRSIWIVCNYDPPGNVSDHFTENVLPRKLLLKSDLDAEETRKSKHHK
ncbi:Golgi-associated plant pathogenesis-related protein 1 [Drosophila santomea]|uniref:Golgi-associated plant pathogenesis-related protein 1 n=1 Tax=Drosophila santomea TaxID=129105 RepID=UPI001954CFED|nr:Golgi-associated plant pathogenesis-related protein 1 [Drosophila santomea]